MRQRPTRQEKKRRELSGIEPTVTAWRFSPYFLLHYKEADTHRAFKESPRTKDPPNENMSHSMNIDGMSPEQLIAQGQADPAWLQAVVEQMPELGTLIVSGDVAKLRLLLMKLYMEASKRKYEADKEMAAIERDPDNPEHQRKIEAAIRQQNVQESYEMAIDNLPESFGRVQMLYVNVSINGCPVKAFVDSGAQMTIMSQRAAEQVGILRLMDTRFAGMAVGVGTGKILGKVHIAQMKFGGSFMPISITVLESNSIDFLFGLDNLRRYRCCIDLSRNVLRAEGSNGPEEVAFLSEHETAGMDVFNGKEAAGGDETGSSSSSGSGSGSNGGSSSSGGDSSSSSSGGGGAGAPPAAAASSPAAASADQGRSEVPVLTNAEKVEQLLALGFAKQESEMALIQAEGDVNLAASLLFASR